MNKKVLIISGYGSKILKPFGESAAEILCGSFKDIGMTVEHIYRRENYVKEILNFDIVLFFMTPELYIKMYNNIGKNNNKFILWNLEPFKFNLDAEDKYTRRRDLILELTNEKYKLDQMWFYNKTQVDYLAKPNCLYVPIGYHKCLSPRFINNKRKLQSVILGQRTTFRTIFFDSIKEEAAANKVSVTRPEELSWMSFVNKEHVKDKVCDFKIGVDVCASEECPKAIKWHRIMVYAASGLILFSDTDLSEFGFINEQDYVKYENAKDFVIKAERMLSSKSLMSSMKQSLLKKVQINYDMVKILRGIV